MQTGSFFWTSKRGSGQVQQENQNYYRCFYTILYHVGSNKIDTKVQISCQYRNLLKIYDIKCCEKGTVLFLCVTYLGKHVMPIICHAKIV
jgi:hypothetical protein